MKFENISASYDVGIAKQFGIQCAVLLNKLIYLSEYTAREDGYCWRSAKELEDELGLTRNQQELAIKKLEEAGIIETKNTYIIGTQVKCKHFKIIVKSHFQESSKSDLLESSKSEMLESSKSVNNNNTLIIKHNNKKENIKRKKYFDNNELDDIFYEFLNIRKKLKAVNSDRAINMLIKKLNSYTDDIKYRMIEQSILHSWKDIYELKEQKNIPKWFNEDLKNKGEIEYTDEERRIWEEIK